MNGSERLLGELGQPRSLVSRVQQFDVGESNRVFDRRHDSVFFREGPEISLDVVPSEGFVFSFLSSTPTAEKFRLGTDRVDEFDVVPAHDGRVRVVGETLDVEELVEGSISSFRMNGGEIGTE